MTKEYAEKKIKGLIKTHNDYRKMNYKEAYNDYRIAMTNLCKVASRQGIKIGFEITRAGYAKEA